MKHARQFRRDPVSLMHADAVRGRRAPIRRNAWYLLAAACAGLANRGIAADILVRPSGTDTATVSAERHAHYRVVLPAGSAAVLTVQQLDGAVELHLRSTGSSADDAPRLDDAGRMASLRVTLLAESRASWQLELAPRGAAPSARYKLTVGLTHPLGARDRDAATAERAWNDAEAVRRTAGSLENGNAREHAVAAGLAGYATALDAAARAADDCLELMALAGRARFHFALGHYPEARDDASRALMHSCGNDVAAAAQQAVAERTLSSAIGYLGDFAQAAEYAEHALAHYEQTGDRNFQAMQRANLSADYRAMGATRKALDYAEAALRTAEDIGDAKRAIFARESIAAIHLQRGELGRALAAYRQTLEKVAVTPYPLIEAMSQNDLGLLYDQLGESDAAAAAYAKSEALWIANGDQSGLAETLLNEGELALNNGDIDSAQRTFERALAFDEAHGLKREQAHALGGLGRCALARGQFDEATRRLSAARDLAHSIGTVVHEASAELALGDLASRQHKTTQELAHYDSAARVAEQAHDAGTLAAALASRARVLLDTHAADAARAPLERAIALIEDERSAIDAPQLRTAFFASRRSYYDLYVHALMQRWREARDPAALRSALEAAENARAVELREQLAARDLRVELAVDAALRDAERNADDALRAAASRQQRLPDNADDETRRAAQVAVDAASRTLDEARGRIRAADPHYAELVHPTRFDLGAAQQLLADGDVNVFEYWLGPEESYAWAISAADVAGFVLPPRAELERDTDTLLRSVVARGDAASNVAFEQRDVAADAWRKVADKLARAALAPLRAHRAGQRIAIVADGELQRLPFALLDADSGGRYTHLPSLATLGQLRARQRSGASGVAVVADPVFSSGDPRVAHATEAGSVTSQAVPTNFPRLPHAQEEAEAIVALHASRDTWLASGFAADRSALLATDWSRYAIAHFATHAVIDLRHPELSGVVLSLFDANGRSVDGFLRANDIYGMRMPVDLVVLSVCDSTRETGRGAEGIFGLSRAFFYAGARRLLVSFWTVDDRASAQLMPSFHRHLAAGEQATDALRAAQAELRADARFRDPYYWAGYAIQGDWR